jgi:superfamily I DNA/RNA helicase|tara:strand:- start:259 stop:1683 length:1425 start_codon:yes stop_codon:yes gene_type:complete
MIYKFYGPPGTGKTHRLISRAKAYVRIKTPLHKIGYFAFTKTAARTAKARMPEEDKKLVHFQTLHSFAYHTLGLEEQDVMQPYHYEDLGKELGIRVKYQDKYNKEEINYLTCDNPYFQMIHKAMNLNITVRELYDRNEHNSKDIDWIMLRHIDKNLKEYKKKKELYDFNDMINELINEGIKKEFEVIFIDEAQDLSPLQWRLYDLLKTKTKDIYLAGDDDQAIFAWAGADVNRFITEPAKEKVLIYSKRISKAVQAESTIPVDKIVGLKKHKKYFARNFEGMSQRINRLDEVDLSNGKWLILTRTQSKLKKIADELEKRNLYFESKRGKSYKSRIYKAAVNYTNWCKGAALDDKYIKDIKEYTGDLEWQKDKTWYQMFIKANPKDKDYIRTMLSKGEKLDEDARIWISTIHAIKGGEEDNVILCLDLGNKVKKAMQKSNDKADEEHRVWYVGITRARNNLYKLKANKQSNEYKL